MVKNKIINILPAIWKLYFAIVFIITLILFYPFFYYILKNEKRYYFGFKLQKLWTYILKLSLGVSVKVIKKSDLPSPPYIICSNHSSYFDIILMYSIFDDYFIFMSKQELNNWPLFKIFFKQMNISVDRSNKIEAHKAFIRASDELNKGHCIVFFPEGTIPVTTPIMNPFKNGAFKLAIEKQIPIVPVTYINNWKLLQGTKIFKGRAGPGRSKAIVHPTVSTKGMTTKDLLPLRNKVFQIIEEELKANS